MGIEGPRSDIKEDIENPVFRKFVEDSGSRINGIGASLGSTIRSAQKVQEVLFQETVGDASKLTDAMIADAFARVDARS